MNIITLFLVLVGSSVFAAESNVTTTASTNLTLIIDGYPYRDVRIKDSTPATVTILHSSGVAVLPIAKLPPELQKQLAYDPAKAAEWTRSQQAQEAEWTRSQQAQKAEKEILRLVTEIAKHLYSVRLLAAGGHNIPNRTEMVVVAETDGDMYSLESPRGYSSFYITDGGNHGFSGAICETGAAVFNTLLHVKGNQAFIMCGYKTADWLGSQYFVVTSIQQLDAESWCGLAEVYEKAGEIEESIVALRHAVKLRPDYAEAWLALATAYRQAGKIDNADRAAERAKELKPELFK
jgi:tetratricopeptide (TPR) repeat protein